MNTTTDRTFAQLTSSPTGVTHGHQNPDCPVIQEHSPWDGSDEDPWPCSTCVEVITRSVFPKINGPSVDAPEGNGSGKGRSRAGASQPSEAQVAYLTSLLEQKHGNDQAPAILDGYRTGGGGAAWTKATVSELIDALQALPDYQDPSGAEKPARTNRYEGRCEVCSQTVPAGEGSLANENGRWITRHFPACPEQPAADSKPAAASYEPGVYVDDSTGQWVKVQCSKTGNCYGKVYDEDLADWEYEGKAALRRPLRKATAQEAAAFGHSTHRCVFCSKELTDERSTEVGYGPTCAGKNGLPWG